MKFKVVFMRDTLSTCPEGMGVRKAQYFDGEVECNVELNQDDGSYFNSGDWRILKAEKIKEATDEPD